MKRTELLKKIEVAVRAVATNDILPIMQHVHFTGEELVAHNGSVTISVPLKTDIACCVPGQIFLNLLKAAGAKEVTLEVEPGDVLMVKGAGTRIKLPTMSAASFPTPAPEAPSEKLRVDVPALVDAIKIGLRSIGTDASRPDQLGVTIIPGTNAFGVWTTNGKTLTRALIKGEFPSEKRICLPEAFCKNFVDLYDGGRLVYALDKDSLTFAWGSIVMRCAFIEVDKPLPFKDVYARNTKDAGIFVPVPSRLERVLGRACVVASGDDRAIRTKITVTNTMAKFVTQSKVGEVKDSLALAAGHADAEIEVDPKAFRLGCGDFNEMVITNDAVCMRNDYASYLIAARD